MFIEFGASRFASERLQDTTATGVDTATPVAAAS
jgi:hypothetical protein